MQHAKRRLTLVLSVSSALFGVMALLLLASSGARGAEMPVPATGASNCQIKSITITAALGQSPGISDTLLHAGISRTVYFAPPSGAFTGTTLLPGGLIVTGNGFITLTTQVDVATGNCYLYSGMAFGNLITSEAVLTAEAPVVSVPYAVSSTQLATQIIQMDVADSPMDTSVLTSPQVLLTFVPDVTPPIIVSQTISTTAAHLYALGTTLYYTDTGGALELFVIQGHSSDSGSGLQHTAFQPIHLGCTTSSHSDSPSPDWSDEYCLRNRPTPSSGAIAVTSTDQVGNSQPVTFHYELDSAPPTSQITPTLPAEHSGLTAIPIRWAATDAGSGIKQTRLYYSLSSTGTWTDTLQAQDGISGTFYFTPTGYGMYYFVTLAVDNMGNIEDISTKPRSQILVRPWYVYLPIILRNYTPFVPLTNGDFSQGLASWTPGGTLGVSTSTDPSSPTNPVALLGNAGYPCDGGVPVGYASLSQTFIMPSLLPGQTLSVTFRYRIYSNDRNIPLSDQTDSFDVLLNSSTVFRDANTTQFDYCNVAPYDLGWRTRSVLVSGYNSGDQVKLDLRVYNRPDGFYNTYVLLDDVKLVVSP